MTLRTKLSLIAIGLLASASSTASAKLEYVPVSETHVRQSLEAFADGEVIPMLSGNADAGTVARARLAAKECPMGTRVIYNRPGMSFSQVNLECSDENKIGFLFVFLEGELNAMEIYPSGIVVVAPPAPPAFKSNEG